MRNGFKQEVGCVMAGKGLDRKPAALELITSKLRKQTLTDYLGLKLQPASSKPFQCRSQEMQGEPAMNDACKLKKQLGGHLSEHSCEANAVRPTGHTVRLAEAPVALSSIYLYIHTHTHIYILDMVAADRLLGSRCHLSSQVGCYNLRRRPREAAGRQRSHSGTPLMTSCVFVG